MGILVLNGPVDLKSDKVGARSTAAGAGVGACLLLVGPAAGLRVGIVGGAVGGALHHNGLKLTDQDKTRIITDLQGGKALRPRRRRRGSPSCGLQRLTVAKDAAGCYRRRREPDAGGAIRSEGPASRSG